MCTFNPIICVRCIVYAIHVVSHVYTAGVEYYTCPPSYPVHDYFTLVLLYLCDRSPWGELLVRCLLLTYGRENLSTQKGREGKGGEVGWGMGGAAVLPPLSMKAAKSWQIV